MTDISKHGDITIMQGPGYVAAVEFSGDYKPESLGEADEPTLVKSFNKESQNSTVVFWGASNTYPQQVLDAVEKNGAAERALEIRIGAHYGNGPIFFKQNYEDGKKSIDLVDTLTLPLDLRKFNKDSRINKFWKECITDLELFSIAFPEYILSSDYRKITKVKRQQAAHCRYEEMEDDGSIGHIYISTKWDEGVLPSNEDGVNSKYMGKTPYIDPYLSTKEVMDYCKKRKIRKFIRPTLRPLKGSSYYPKTAWHSVFKNGWIGLSPMVADLKKSMFKNQSIILYHIEVTIDYFENKYKDKWHDMTAKEQDDKRDELLTSLNDKLTDVKNTHKSLMTIRYKDEMGNYVEGVTIKAVDNKIKDGSYLPEASAGNSEVLFAFGVDPTLIGHGVPGGKLGGGGGSDKREAFTILNALMKTPRETTLEIWDFIKEFNAYEEDLMAGFESTILTTLDKNPTGQENTTGA
jgi:hypothetical protein